jgi:16S rRNA (uracil1498-N3)-methyltransferase
LEYLSDIELYYSPEKENNRIIVSGEEKNHIIRVMRHKEGDNLYVTDGKGNIFKTTIELIEKDYLASAVEEIYKYTDEYNNFIFCIPKLKNPDRFEFALEKSVELGITRFIIYNASKGISKGNKTDRWEKILISAMKQSLRSYKPVIHYINTLSEINRLPGNKIIFEQKSRNVLTVDSIEKGKDHYFIFGPESGLDSEEVSSVDQKEIYKFSPNRLRTETAIIKAASLLTLIKS